MRKQVEKAMKTAAAKVYMLIFANGAASFKAPVTKSQIGSPISSIRQQVFLHMRRREGAGCSACVFRKLHSPADSEHSLYSFYDNGSLLQIGIL